MRVANDHPRGGVHDRCRGRVGALTSLALLAGVLVGPIGSFCLGTAVVVGRCSLGVADEVQGLPARYDNSEAQTAKRRAALYQQLRNNAEVLEAQSAVFKAVAKLIVPSVVHIEAGSGSPMRGGNGSVEEAGSGVIIQYKGKHYVLTNRHVIRNAAPDNIKLRLRDGRILRPVRLLGDPDTDVAVIAVDGENLIAAPLGDSDRMEIGDFVLAVGSPFGLSHSISFGIISAKGRRNLQLNNGNPLRFQDFLQTDTAINPGNSGGPLVNLHGEVIGINTAIASETGFDERVAFSIPSNMVMFAAAQLIETGQVRRGFLGVNLDARYGEAEARRVGLPCPMGARISGINPGTPATRVDLRVDDIILEMNGHPVEDDGHLVNLVGQTPVGAKVPLLVYRDGSTFHLEVEVGDRERLQQR